MRSAEFGKDATGMLREVVKEIVTMKQDHVRPPDQHRMIRQKYGANFGPLIQGLPAIELTSDGTMPKRDERLVLYSNWLLEVMLPVILEWVVRISLGLTLILTRILRSGLMSST